MSRPKRSRLPRPPAPMPEEVDLGKPYCTLEPKLGGSFIGVLLKKKTALYLRRDTSRYNPIILYQQILSSTSKCVF